MSRIRHLSLIACAIAFALVGVSVHAGQGMVSSIAQTNGVSSYMGYRLVPAPQAGVRFIAGDEAPAQIFELVRPINDRVTLERIFTSCSCIQVEAPKRTYEPGEPILLTLRNVRPTPPAGQMYSMYVQIAQPVRTTLRQDVFIQSDRFRQPQPVTYDRSYRW